MEERRKSQDRLAPWIEPIRKGSLLGGLSVKHLRDLLEQGDFVRLSPGDVLIRQGETADSAFVVLTGQLEVIIETTLGNLVIAHPGPLEIVGETAIFTQRPRAATVVALEKSTLMRLNGKDFAAIITHHPEAARGLLDVLGRRITTLNQPLAMLVGAAQALEHPDIDADVLTVLLNDSDQFGPFAPTLRKLLGEMEHKQSRLQEMAVAARLQQSILPRPLDFAARNAPYVIEAFMRPAREIGGDFFDFFFTEDNKRAVLLVADVSGKGIPAALFMAVSRTLFRSLALTAPSIVNAFDRMNAQLDDENPECLFVTMFAAELNLATGSLTYVNAGHCEGYVLGADGNLAILPPTGPAVALMPKPAFHTANVQLSPGDVVVLISDGVTEAFSAAGEAWGENRLENVLSGLTHPTAHQAVAAIEQAVSTFAAGAEQSDDITCLALARL